MALVRGTLVSFSAGTYTATVRPSGSPGEVMADLKVARSIAAAEMTAGRAVLIDTGESGELEEVVVYAVYV